MTFGERLTALRKEKGYSVRNDFAEYLGIPTTTLRNYEKGDREPGHSFLIQMSELFNVSIDYLLGTTEERERVLPCDLKSHEIEHIKKYRNLDDHGRQTVDIILDRETTRVTSLSERDDRIKALEAEQASHSIPRRIFAYYGKIAAAGTWVDFSDLIAGTKEYYLTDENANADYTIGVNGDSMEPTYYDGDIVFVKSATHLNIGDIGIFQKDNSIYIKEVGENGLISHKQEKYPPMINGGDVRCWGKVVGKVTEDMIIAD